MDSALCGQSTTSAPYWLNDVVISSANRKRERERRLEKLVGGAGVFELEKVKEKKKQKRVRAKSHLRPFSDPGLGCLRGWGKGIIISSVV